MTDRFPEFRLGSVLATSFTGTLSERHGDAIERIPTPGRLVEWLQVSGLNVQSCTSTQLERARELREAIHTAATAVAQHEHLPASTVEVINDFSAQGRAASVLTVDGTQRWQLSPQSSVADALGVIAADAISILAGERDGKLALCASPTCQAAFCDSSQSRSRRWCEMNTCGNRAKKARFNASKARSASA